MNKINIELFKIEIFHQTLHNLTHLAPGYMVANVLPELLRLCGSIDLNGRHGAITALGEVLAALAECLPQEKTIENVLGKFCSEVLICIN